MRIRRAHLLLLASVIPFVVAFDIPDSSGTWARVSGGRGTYHLIGCSKREFDSEFWEGQIALRHAMRLADSASPAWVPAYATIGTHADFIVQDMTVVKDTVSGAANTLGDRHDENAFDGGAYMGLDWKWVGLESGLGYAFFNPDLKDAEKRSADPMLGLRLGLTDRVYLTAEVAGSNPYLTGGARRNLGVGTLWDGTRIWAGVGDYDWDGATTLGLLRLDRAVGPWSLSLAGQFGFEEVPPANLGVDREYGFSLGVAYRLSSLR